MSYQSLATSPSLASTSSFQRRHYYHRSCLQLPKLSTPCLGFTSILLLTALFILRLSTSPDQYPDIHSMREQLLHGAEGVLDAVKNATTHWDHNGLWGWEEESFDVGESSYDAQEVGKLGDAALSVEDLESTSSDLPPARPEQENKDYSYVHTVVAEVDLDSLDTPIDPDPLPFTDDDLTSSTAQEQVDEKECSDNEKSLLVDVSFWRLKRVSAASYTISPRLSTSLPESCLRSTIFSARLISTVPPIIFGLPTPTPSFAEPGKYLINIDPSPLPGSTYELEVALDFPFLQGGLSGMVCGQVQDCKNAALGRLGITSAFIGKCLEWERGEELTRLMKVTPGAFESEAEVPLCTTFSPLSGFWEAHKFRPISAQDTQCRLLSPSLPLVITPPKTIWISLLGDSNSRNLFGHLTSSFGRGPSDSFFTTESPSHNGTVALVAFRSSTGQVGKGSKAIPDIIVTWRWWTESDAASQRSRDEHTTELIELADTNLQQFLTKVGMPNALHSHSSLAIEGTTMKATRTYISLGSHAEGLTALGTRGSLDSLLGPKRLSEDMIVRNNIKFFTTTLVNPSHIPLDRFPLQDRVRNNAVIQARNQVMRERDELEGRVVDVEAVTRGITADWMKEGGRAGSGHRKLDAVHFQAWVYDAWVDLIWTDVFGVEQRD